MNPLTRGVLAVGVGSMFALGSGGTAMAQPVDVSSGDTGQHCVIAAQPNAEAPVTTMRCFDTLQDSLSAATGRTVKLAPGQRVPTSADLAPASGTVVGIEFKDANFGGGTLTLSATTAGFVCSGGAYVNFASMPSGWNDTIGSARTYSNCKSGHFEYTNNGGSVKICGCATMGVMNDKTSSIRFSVSGL